MCRHSLEEITAKTAKNGSVIYYVDGKRTSYGNAQTIAVNQNKQKLKILLEKFEETTGIKESSRSFGTNQVEVNFKGYIYSGVRTNFDTFEDVIKFAKYVYENFDGINSVNARGRDYQFEYWIDNEGETARTDDAKKIIEKLNAESANDEISERAQEILHNLGYDKLQPNKNDSLGKTYGKMESDGTFTVKFDKEFDDTQKFNAVKNIAEKLGGKVNSFNQTFRFEKIEDVATFFKAVRTAFYGKRDNSRQKQNVNPEGVTLPENYFVEGEKQLQDSKATDFIVDENGNKNFGEINSDIEEKTNGIVKAAPIRLQIGNGDFGFIHITAKHLDEIQNKGYSDAISYIKKILDNVNKIYSRADTGNLNRFLLCSEGRPGHSKDFMPIDLELEKGADDFYNIVTAYPKSDKNIEGILIFDDSTHSSPVTATGSLMQSADDKSGVDDQGANAKINIPSAENISQSTQNGNENSAEKVRKEISRQDFDFFVNNLKYKVFDYNSDWQNKAVELLGKKIPESVSKATDIERAFANWLGKEINPVIEYYEGDGEMEIRFAENGMFYFAPLEEIQKPNTKNNSTEENQPQSETLTQDKFEVGTFKNKIGKEKFSAKLREEVDDNEYRRLVQLANKHNGIYSVFSKHFIFDTAENRDAFIAESIGENISAENLVANIEEEKSKENSVGKIESIIVEKKSANGSTMYYEVSSRGTSKKSQKNSEFIIKQGRAIKLEDASDELKLKIAMNRIFSEWQRFNGFAYDPKFAPQKGSEKYATKEKAEEILNRINNDEVLPSEVCAEFKNILNVKSDEKLNEINNFIAKFNFRKPKGSGKWVTLGSSPSREELKKLLKQHLGAELRDDNTWINYKGEIIRDQVREHNGRWQYGYYEDSGNETKFAGKGDLKKMFAARKEIPDEKLKSWQKKWVEFGEDSGVKVVWIDAHKDLNGAVQDGTIYINRKANENPTKTFHHEIFHMISALNPNLHQDLLEHFTGKNKFTAEQLENYRRENNREDLTDKEVIEEILADNFGQIQKRVLLMQEISKGNPSLIKRLVAFIKNLAEKFVSYFHNPEGGMTTAQRDAFLRGFNNLAGSLKDAQGKSLFKTSGGGKILKLSDGKELPKNELEFSFAGEKAQTADFDSLKQAKKLERQGKNRNEIYQKTGWFKGRDDKWRFEIPDNLDKIDFSPLEIYGESTLEEIYDNPALYQAYPKLANVKVFLKKMDSDTAGFARANEIGLSDNKSASARKSTLIHEIQHLIQGYEKFAKGTDNVRAKNDFVSVIGDSCWEMEKLAKKLDLPKIEENFDSKLAALYDLQTSPELAKAGNKIADYAEKVIPDFPQKYHSKLRKYVQQTRRASEILQSDLSNDELYRRSGGEQEAREVQARAFDSENYRVIKDAWNIVNKVDTKLRKMMKVRRFKIIG